MKHLHYETPQKKDHRDYQTLFWRKKCCLYESCCHDREMVMAPEVKEIKNIYICTGAKLSDEKHFCYWIISPGFLLFWLFLLFFFVNLGRRLLPNLLSCLCISGNPLDIVDITVNIPVCTSNIWQKILCWHYLNSVNPFYLSHSSLGFNSHPLNMHWCTP